MKTFKIKTFSKKIELSKLKIHPSAKAIYSHRNIARLAESIVRFEGVIENIIVNKDNVVLSGWRRKLACEQLGIQFIMCDVVENLNEDDEPFFIIDCNAYRQKTYEEKYGEIKILYAQLQKRQGTRSDVMGSEPFDSRKMVAEAIDSNPAEVNNIQVIGEHDPDLLKTIDGKNVTLSGLAQKIRQLKKDGKEKYTAIQSVDLETILACPTCGSKSTPRINVEDGKLYLAA